MIKFPIYLDHNATTPCDSRVVEAMLPYFSNRFGNAASHQHAFGWEAKEAVEMAREQVAALVGSEPEEIVFTSGGTESDNLALKGIFELQAGKGRHIITSSIEHKAVLDACKHLEKMGAEVDYLPVNENGILDLDLLKKTIRPSTILLAFMYANNELGTILPVKEIAEIAGHAGVFFFSDAVQAAGKIPVDVNRDGIHVMAIAAHKLYGPKGVGALYIRRKNPRVKLATQIDGGGHERGFRSGTLNVPGIVGFGKAAELAKQEMDADAQRLSKLRDRLEAGLKDMEGTQVNGAAGPRLPHVSNMSFSHVNGSALMAGLQKEIAVSSGSACMSASPEPSYVLKAIGLDDDLAHSSLRFGLGRWTTEEEIDYTIERVTNTVNELREFAKVKV